MTIWEKLVTVLRFFFAGRGVCGAIVAILAGCVSPQTTDTESRSSNRLDAPGAEMSSRDAYRFAAKNAPDLGETGSRVALVIGNGNYLTTRKLKNPDNDATAMAATLKRFGFKVIEREDVTRRQLVQAVRTFAESLAPGGIGLFFYAGHGIQAQGASYLVPVDANLAVEDDLKYEAFDVQDLLSKLDDARVGLSLVILDACRDNPFPQSHRSMAGGLAPINPPRGTFIAYATAPGKVAADGDGKNSVYTTELLKAMSVPGRKLQDVFSNVADAVELETQHSQTPWTNSSFRGDFYFVGPTTVTVLPSAEANLATPEIVFWQSIATSTNPADFEAYLQQFPQGSFAPLAKVRIASLRLASATASASDESHSNVVVPPSPDVPGNLAAFSGHWIGVWDNNPQRSTSLTIRSVSSTGAVTGTYKFMSITQSFEATISDNSLKIGIITFKLRPDGKIDGIRNNSGLLNTTTLTRG